MPVTVSVILDTRRIKKKTGKYPVKLRVINERSTQYYTTIYELTEEEFQKLSQSRKSEQLQEIKYRLDEIEVSARKLAMDQDAFDFVEFEKDFILNNPAFIQRQFIRNNIAAASQHAQQFDFSPFYYKFPALKEPVAPPDTIAFTFVTYIKRLILQERISTAVSYHCAYVSFMKFSGNVRFQAANVDYLLRYEQWTKQRGMSRTTLGMYTRSLRAIFNEAIENGIIKREKCYPFGRRRYQVPSSRNIKKALPLDNIEKIYHYQPTCESEAKAKAFWLFCYFGNGINPKDIALLRFKNIHDEYIIFERAKTERATRTDPKQITIYLSKEIAEIIEQWGNKDKSPENYIFPILRLGLTPLEQYHLIQYFVRLINDWMIKICQNLNIDKKATTYVARHSFATVLKRSGVSTEFIKEALGHHDLKTTELYLGSFGNEMKKEFALRLSDFKGDGK